MAEFQEVMRQWRRMCADGKTVCRGLPDENETKTIEGFVMAWAAGHPEPVYPTWGDWLAEIGLINWQYNGDGVYSVMVPTFKMCNHIPADVAEKLGLQPKEG